MVLCLRTDVRCRQSTIRGLASGGHGPAGNVLGADEGEPGSLAEAVQPWDAVATSSGDGDVLSAEARMALHCRNKEGGIGIVLGRRVGEEDTAMGSRG